MESKSGNFITSIVTTLKSVAPVLAVVETGIAAFKLIDYSDHGFTQVSAKVQTVASEYINTKSVLASLNSQLATTQTRITELQALQVTGTISFATERKPLGVPLCRTA